MASAVALNLAAGAGIGISVGVGVGSLGFAADAVAKTPNAAQTELPTVAIGSLPPEAQSTFQLIHAGGPFPYGKDGTVFLNRERHLPAKSRGYYREYTVKTPRSRDRGPRRIVCGGPPKLPQACYYTADHYTSFSRITAP
ncbi:MAG: ribonuclease N [Burkholderiales bacterium]|nr:ribonuclease N [Burkholderiales bacterium]